jgi:hypothetical protein
MRINYSNIPSHAIKHVGRRSYVSSLHFAQSDATLDKRNHKVIYQNYGAKFRAHIVAINTGIKSS